MITKVLRRFLIALLFLPVSALAALPAVTPTVRYMALGDSLAAGYKAQPATAGYVYQLYLGRAFGSIPDTVFDNASVPGATSADVRKHQVEQVGLFKPNVVTISVGGNDLLTILQGADPATVVGTFAANLQFILARLCLGDPATGAPPVERIYLHNLYTIPEIPGATDAVVAFNAASSAVVAGVTAPPAGPCAGKTVAVADVFNAFLGQQGLLLIERFEKKGFENTFEVHPTNKGHRVIEGLFRALIAQ